MWHTILVYTSGVTRRGVLYGNHMCYGTVRYRDDTGTYRDGTGTYRNGTVVP